MKKILVLVAMLCIATGAFACNICGCASAGNYFGILPEFHKNFAGLRYQYRDMDITHIPLFPGETGMKSRESFQTLEAWGRYIPVKNLQLFAFVPYSFYNQQPLAEQEPASVSGIGDVRLMANIVLINNDAQECNNWKHALQVGGGIQLPTGRSDISETDHDIILAGMQPGTGAFEFPLNVIYTLRYRNSGLNAEINYQVNSANRQGYRFGNNFSSSLRYFYWQKIKNTVLLPQADLSFEQAQADKISGVRQDYSGGNALFAGLGADLYFRKFSVGIKAQKPVYENVADKHLQTGIRFSGNISFLF